MGFIYELSFLIPFVRIFPFVEQRVKDMAEDILLAAFQG